MLMDPECEPQFVDGHALVGLVGEFENAKGETCQCRVTGTDRPPWDNDLLVIDYVTPDGMKVTGAMIPASIFRPDARASNDKLTHGPNDQKL